MNQLTALFFPQTILDANITRRILFFFDRIFYYQTTGNDDSNRENVIESGLCHGYAPVPAGKDLTHFKHLVNDLKKHGDEFYLNYLSSLSLEETQSGDEASVRSLMSCLTNDATQKKLNTRERDLWQASFLLTLVEILEQDNKDIEQGLRIIKDHKLKMWHALRGDGPDSATSGGNLPDQQITHGQRQTTRDSAGGPYQLNHERILKAWGQLFLADESPDRPQILITACQDTAGLLFDAYENFCAKKPLKIFDLTIPHTKGRDGYLETRNSFRESVSDCLRKFNEIIMHAASGESREAVENQGATAFLKNTLDTWAKTIDDLSCQEKIGGESRLSFFCFQGISFPVLVSRISNVTLPKTQDISTAGILAVLDTTA